MYVIGFNYLLNQCITSSRFIGKSGMLSHAQNIAAVVAIIQQPVFKIYLVIIKHKMYLYLVIIL